MALAAGVGFVRRLSASNLGTGGQLRLLASGLGMGSRNASPRINPLFLRPLPFSVTKAATNGALGGARLFSGGDKGKSPIRDELLSSSDGEDGKLPTSDGLRSSSVRDGKLPVRDEIPKVINPQLEPAVEEERAIQKFLKLLDLMERLRMSDKDWEMKLKEAVTQLRDEFERLLALLKAQNDEKLSDAIKNISECHGKIKDLEIETKLLNQKYELFKDSNDARIENVKYSVIKYIFGTITVFAGSAVTIMKFKDSITSFLKELD